MPTHFHRRFLTDPVASHSATSWTPPLTIIFDLSRELTRANAVTRLIRVLCDVIIITHFPIRQDFEFPRANLLGHCQCRIRLGWLVATSPPFSRTPMDQDTWQHI